MPPPALIEPQTRRLRLRQWMPDDRAPFAALNADPRVMAYLPAALRRTDSDALADRLQSFIAEHGWGFWAVELKASGEFIGFVGPGIPSPALPVSPCVEIGWRLAHRFWGQGHATEAARESLRIEFEVLGLTEVVPFTSVLNLRSRAVMERPGMTPDPEIFEDPGLPVDHRLREHWVDRRLSGDDWAAGGASPAIRN